MSIARLEDILIAKLAWSRLGDSALQRRDVLQLLKRTWERLDPAYVEKWVGDLGLRSGNLVPLEASVIRRLMSAMRRGTDDEC